MWSNRNSKNSFYFIETKLCELLGRELKIRLKMEYSIE